MNRPTRACLALFAVVAACACASGQPTAPSHPPEQDTKQDPKPSEVEPIEEETPEPADNSCGKETCVPPEQCIRYYGIAGPSIQLYTCGQPCGDEGQCPSGMSCATIADGPRLCR